MKQIVLLITALFLRLLSSGQSDDPWIRFFDTTTELSGYKDLKDNIKIPARFGGFTRADTFYNIIAVNETLGDSLQQYYLLKNGKKLGYDSVYVSDFQFDCEREGKILYKDRKKDRVGFLDKDGSAIIPAIYNYASPFRNGIAIAHQNAKRKCWEKNGDTTNCEHLGWEGGQTILINEKNEILADSLLFDVSTINWYSKKVNDPSVDTSIYVNIQGNNGLIYSFVDYDKEFHKWFYNSFLPSLKNGNSIQSLLFGEVTFWSETNGWTSIPKNNFLKNFPAALTVQRFKSGGLKEISIQQELFNEFIFEKKLYKKYLTACGEHDKEQYPLYNVMLTYYLSPEVHNPEVQVANSNRIDYQEHFEFLRTENGYRLLSVSLKNKK